MAQSVTKLLAFGGALAWVVGCSYDWEAVSLDTDPTHDTSSDDTDSGSEVVDPDHPCFNVVCDSPWPPDCDGASELTVYGPESWCRPGDTDSTQGICEYEERRITCLSGQCTNSSGPDYCVDYPCLGLDCHWPSEPLCASSSSLNVPHRFGRCAPSDTDSSPGCVYSTTPVDCAGSGCQRFDTDSGGALALDGCVDDPCLHRICNSPPPRYCVDDKLVLFEAMGRCGDDGQCVYKSRLTSCQTGICRDGRCEDDPCSQVTCRRPPANFCLPDGQTLRTYIPAGVCVAEQGRPVCQYDDADISCPDPLGCEDGRCMKGAPADTDECFGVAEHCASIDSDPPAIVPLANHCRDASTLVHWNASGGSCFDGVCLFEYVEESNEPCVDGTAESRCSFVLCVDAPAPYCNGDTLVTYSSLGLCTGDNLCHFELQETTCFGGCDPLLDPFQGTCS